MTRGRGDACAMLHVGSPDSNVVREEDLKKKYGEKRHKGDEWWECTRLKFDKTGKKWNIEDGFGGQGGNWKGNFYGGGSELSSIRINEAPLWGEAGR